MKTPDERPFEDYIRRALIDELKVAEMLSDLAPVTLTGSLGRLDFNSMKGEWTMDMTFTSSNGRSLTLPTLYSYKTGCARYYWSRPGSTVEQFDQDSRECALRTSANPTEASHGIVNDKAYRVCLEGRQWVRTKQSVPPPPGSDRGIA